MAVTRPTSGQIQAVALSLGIHLDDAKSEAYLQLLQPNFDAYDAVDAMPDFVPAVKYARGKSYRPTGTRTNTVPGTSSRPSPAHPAASWPARPWPSRTTCAWPACR